MDRRSFLQSISIAPFWNGLKGRSLPVPDTGRGRSEDRPAPIGRKAVLISMLPEGVSYAQRFAMARDAGFDAVEMQTTARDDEAAEVRDAAMKTELRIHSVMNADHWRFPLS